MTVTQRPNSGTPGIKLGYGADAPVSVGRRVRQVHGKQAAGFTGNRRRVSDKEVQTQETQGTQRFIVKGSVLRLEAIRPQIGCNGLHIVNVDVLGRVLRGSVTESCIAFALVAAVGHGKDGVRACHNRPRIVTEDSCGEESSKYAGTGMLWPI